MCVCVCACLALFHFLFSFLSYSFFSPSQRQRSRSVAGETRSVRFGSVEELDISTGRRRMSYPLDSDVEALNGRGQRIEFATMRSGAPLDDAKSSGRLGRLTEGRVAVSASAAVTSTLLSADSETAVPASLSSSSSSSSLPSLLSADTSPTYPSALSVTPLTAACLPSAMATQDQDQDQDQEHKQQQQLKNALPLALYPNGPRSPPSYESYELNLGQQQQKQQQQQQKPQQQQQQQQPPVGGYRRPNRPLPPIPV